MNLALLQKAVKFIKDTDVLIIGAGAGIGKDSGLPDFRGNQGFWNHYPPYKGKFDFFDCANPLFLEKQPNLFWGFYGSRLQMYQRVIPHAGFSMIKSWQQKLKKQIFVVTSNVDGHFKKAKFQQNQVYQINGSIHHLQCDECLEISDNNFQPSINYEKMSCQNLPFCPKCKGIMRPNILMFNDYNWISERTQKQQKQYIKLIQRIQKQNKKICLIQIGAGNTVPTIRNTLQRQYYQNKSSSYIRINPDPQNNTYNNHQRYIHIQLSSLQALTKLNKFLQ